MWAVQMMFLGFYIVGYDVILIAFVLYSGRSKYFGRPTKLQLTADVLAAVGLGIAFIGNISWVIISLAK